MTELKAYNGLIRNWKELAAELGVDVAGCTRAEREEKILIAAYERWGEQMGTRINGQFGAALYDDGRKELFCLRDPLGAELFYYYETADGRLLYGTQIGDIASQAGFVRELNRPLLQFYLTFNYVPGEETLFRGIYKLEPGGFLVFGADGLKRGRWWELEFHPDESKTLDDWADELTEAMEASLRDICEADEQPDSFLSGGVDSSYILAKSRAHTGYCVSYANERASEEAEARETAAYLGRGFEGVRVTPEEFFATVDEFLRAYEQPSADVAGLSLYVAAKKVTEKSTLCFSGEGADEFFAGYSVYQNPRRLRISPDPVYCGCTYIMNAAEQRRFLREYDAARPTRDFMKRRGAAGRSYDLVTYMLFVELRSYFEGSILFNSTRISRGTGLDIRMPYCDLRIFDIALRMPARFKVGDGKNKVALRRAALRALPEKVAYRRKLGFPVPVREWLANPAYNADIHRAFEGDVAAEFFNVKEIGALLDALEGRKPRVAHPVWFRRHAGQLWRYVWTVYTFIRWHELFFEDAS